MHAKLHIHTPMVEAKYKQVTIIMADDDPDDCLLMKDAFEEQSLTDCLRVVEDGEELLEYLRLQGPYGDRKRFPPPDLIILDLNMPRKDGRTVLREIKADPQLKRIPVVIFTTSREREDINRSYDLGASSFIVKPVSYQDLKEVVKTLNQYWLHTVELPDVASSN